MAVNADLQIALQQAEALAGRRQFAEAEVQYRRARVLDPRDLRAALGHGHVLLILGRAAEARDVFAAATAIKPDLADAFHGLAMACYEMSDIAAAENAYRTVLKLEPRSLAAMVGLADVFNRQRRADEALALLAPVGDLNANAGAAVEQTRGTARLIKADAITALAHFERALAMAPGFSKAAHSRAVALEQLGREEDALSAYRKTVADTPSNLGAHQGLNQLLYRLKRDSEFLRSYDEAAGLLPNVPHFAIAKAEFLSRVGKAAEAASLYDRALAIAPGHPIALQGKAGVLLKLGQADAAIDLFQHVLKHAPDDVTILTSLATAYLMTRDAAKAEAVATDALKRDPTDQVGLAALGTALRLRGDEREQALNRYDEFVQVIDLEPPSGYADMASFNQELNAWLDSQHSDAREPIDQSLRGGTQTQGDIFSTGHRLINALQARMAEAVNRFIAGLPRDDRHPFLNRRTGGFAFAGSWSSRLCDQGFHTNHLHPGGWISSAYYVSLPAVVAETDRNEGWLQFGAPSYDIGLAKPVRRAVQPQPGRLVLFPSYMWHGTVPFRAPQNRTTIAFDVVPHRS
jgi:tetratricopeptide (TPR) repeat protein